MDDNTLCKICSLCYRNYRKIFITLKKFERVQEFRRRMGDNIQRISVQKNTASTVMGS